MGFFSNQPAPIVAQMEAVENKGVHNFSIGTLTAYFKLESCKADFKDGVLVLDGLPGSSPRKVFVYKYTNTVLERLKELQRTSVIYSITELPLPKGSTFKELAYDLDTVFKPASYPNAKKRHQRLVYPFKCLENQGIVLTPLHETYLGQVRELHDAWCKHKLSLPATFKMMFPQQRYYNCCTLAIKQPEKYRSFSAWQSGVLLGVRVLYVEGSYAFDLANFSATWGNYTCSNFSEYFGVATMKHLRNSGIKVLNCGASLNKQLSSFKKHWPNYAVESFAYGKMVT